MMAKIIFIGDSITKGTSYGGVSVTDTFAYKIGISSGYAPTDIINAGANSDTSAGILARLNADVISKSPAVCVVMVGMNDWQNGVTVASYASNIGAIFDALTAGGITVVALTSNMQRGSTAAIFGFQPFLRVFENAAAARGIHIVDLYREVGTSYLYLSATQFYANYVDAVHLSKAGHLFVAELAARACHSKAFVTGIEAIL